MAESLSFEEYRERVGRQVARDRDRWFGTDEHREEPLYSAAGGIADEGLADWWREKWARLCWEPPPALMEVTIESDASRFAREVTGRVIFERRGER